MKYYNMIDVGSRTADIEPVVQTTATPVEQPVNQIPNNLDSRLDEIMELIKNGHQNATAPDSIEHSQMDDNQAGEIMSTLLQYQDEYFSDVPLSKDLIQPFVWNLPPEIYNAHIDAKVLEYPVVMDPLFWFYIFCMANPKEAMAKYITLAFNALDDSDTAVIEEKADEYDNM